MIGRRHHRTDTFDKFLITIGLMKADHTKALLTELFILAIILALRLLKLS